jgi:hypothetical protein
VTDDKMRQQMDRIRFNELRHEDNLINLTRYIGFALAALPLTFLLSGNPVVISTFTKWRTVILLCSIFGTLTILAEFLQHLLGARAAEHAKANADYKYDPTSFAYVASTTAAKVKNFTAFVGGLFFLWMIVGETLPFEIVRK